MFRTKVLFSLCAALVVSASTVWAQTNQPQKIHRASNLADLEVHNGEGENAESLGHIEDIIVDLRNGQFIYYAMGHGQTFGLGGKMFAVGPQSLALSKDHKPFVLNGVTSAELDKMEGFDANKWPAEPNKRWAAAKGPITKTVNEVKETLKGDPRLARVNKLIGSSVRPADNKDLGEIYDLALVVDSNRHKVAYVVVSYGDTLGVGGKLYAVPLDKIEATSPKLNPSQRVFTVNITQEQLKQQAGFTSNENWPAQTDNAFWSKVKAGGRDSR